MTKQLNLLAAYTAEVNPLGSTQMQILLARRAERAQHILSCYNTEEVSEQSNEVAENSDNISYSNN